MISKNKQTTITKWFNYINSLIKKNYQVFLINESGPREEVFEAKVENIESNGQTYSSYLIRHTSYYKNIIQIIESYSNSELDYFFKSSFVVKLPEVSLGHSWIEKL